MRDFAAIDFETANREATSVCAVGVVVVRDGVLTDTFYSLVKPYPNYYSFWNVRVHGITARDTADALEFPAVWQQVEARVGELPLVAHNKRFDEACMRAAMEHYGIPDPGREFLCTLVAARRVFGKSLPNHRLPTVAAACGFKLPFLLRNLRSV